MGTLERKQVPTPPEDPKTAPDASGVLVIDEILTPRTGRRLRRGKFAGQEGGAEPKPRPHKPLEEQGAEYRDPEGSQNVHRQVPHGKMGA